MDVNAIFDAFGKAAKRLIIEDAYDKKLSQIKSCQAKRCGNCDHWMKSSCVPEKKNGAFKSMNSMACNDFVLGFTSKYLLEDFNKELCELKGRLFQGNGRKI